MFNISLIFCYILPWKLLCDIFMDWTSQREILTQCYKALLAYIPFTPGNGQEDYPKNRELLPLNALATRQKVRLLSWLALSPAPQNKLTQIQKQGDTGLSAGGHTLPGWTESPEPYSFSHPEITRSLGGLPCKMWFTNTTAQPVLSETLFS